MPKHYHFTHHILNEAMPARGLSRADVLRVMEQGASWRHYEYSMRTRLDDLTVCWEGAPTEKRLITIWDNSNQIQTK